MSKEEFKAYSLKCVLNEKTERKAKEIEERKISLEKEARRKRRALKAEKYVSCPKQAAHWEQRAPRRELIARKRLAMARLGLSLDQVGNGLPEGLKIRGLATLIEMQGRISIDHRQYYWWDRLDKCWYIRQHSTGGEDRPDSGSGYGRHAD